ncbi:MAG: parvulin-like peptidyl-prolyl isomerase [Verrucomicrobiales bacterium]
MKRLSILVLIAAIAAGCSAGSDSTLVDGVEIVDDDIAALHVDVSELDDDERAGSLLLLILREAFGATAANQFDLLPNEADVDAAYQVQVERFAGRGGIETVLEASNQTPARIRIESELDVIRDAVSETLVRTEATGFDIGAAYESYLLTEAEVCIRQMQLESGPDFDLIVARLNAGEAFADVARDVSIDPFVGREDGVGAGGDLGCSAPSALPGGLDTATLLAPLNEPTGPVIADTGLYLLEVYERTAPDLANVRSDVIDLAVDAQGPDLFRQWAIEVLQTIDVEVAEAFGAWGILPETDPVPTVVPPYRMDAIIDEAS